MLVFAFSSVAFAEEWICLDCGAPNSANFCTQCGAKKPEEIVCPGCGAKYSANTDALFCGECGTKLQQAEPAVVSVRYEGEGFATPEEALTCYMEGLKNLDFNQMLSAFAWETQMEHYSVLTNLERIMIYSVLTHPRMPSSNSFMFAANLNDMRSYQIDLINRSLVEYILGEDSPTRTQNGRINFEEDTDQAAEFLKKFDNGRLEKLTQMTNIRFLSPDAVTDNKFSLERSQRIFAKQNACFGADETVNIVGLADVGDEMLYCCPTICRYGDKWYLVSVGSMTSNMLGVPMQYQAFACGKGSLDDLIR